ncbi:hypothetical protein ACFQNJ_03595 [Hydrogenophaga bisanensis]|uniref:Uncharacterized protein n=1 Tax=Hydrogenophaga bisanensis TaxID=439611 RepID=A0ABW2R531_9BURK
MSQQANREKKEHLMWAVRRLTDKDCKGHRTSLLPTGLLDTGFQVIVLRKVVDGKEIEMSLPGVLRVRDWFSGRLLAMSCAPNWLHPLDEPDLVSISPFLIDDTANRLESMASALACVSSRSGANALKGSRWLRTAGPAVFSALKGRRDGLLELDEQTLRQISKGGDAM